MGHRGRCCEDYGHRIEPDFLPEDVGVTRELASGSDYARALLGANSTVGGAIFVGLAGFHFDEYQAVILPPDEIDFSGAGSHAIVAGDDDNPMALQVTVGDILATAAEGVVSSEVALPGMIPEDIGEFV